MGRARHPLAERFVKRVNLDEIEFEKREHPGFTCRRGRIGWRLGSERLGASLWELPPGEVAYPYHFHLTEEELILVMEGAPSLRTPEGWSELRPGDVVSFPPGEAGGHQVANRGDEPVRFLAVSTSGAPDVVRYPDEGKLAAAERPPTGTGLMAIFREDDAVGYWDGVEPPS